MKYYSASKDKIILNNIFNFDEKNNLGYSIENFYNVINRQEESNINLSKKVTAVLDQYKIWRKHNELR